MSRFLDQVEGLDQLTTQLSVRRLNPDGSMEPRVPYDKLWKEMEYHTAILKLLFREVDQRLSALEQKGGLPPRR